MKYGDKVIIKADKEYGGFYDGVEAVVIARMEPENVEVIIGKKIPVNYSLLLPKLGDKERFLEVSEDNIKKI